MAKERYNIDLISGSISRGGKGSKGAKGRKASRKTVSKPLGPRRP